MSGGFADLGLQQELLTAIDDLGWLLPTDIQDEAIPLILGGGDVMGAAETGSGKTAAFALPIIQSVHERLRGINNARNSNPQSGRSNNNAAKTVIRLNERDKEDGILVSSDGNGCSYTTTSNNWVGVRATHGVNRGRFFYEVEVLEKGNCRVGWSTIAAHLELGKDSQGFGYGGKGWKSWNGNYEKYGGEYSQGDFIGVYLDMNNKQIFFSKNGNLLEIAYTIPEDVIGTVLFPTIALSNSAVNVNFGYRPFQFPPETGYLPISKSFNLFDQDSSEAYVTKGPRKPLAIIIEPTRDLAEQVYQSFVDLSRYLDQPKLAIHLLIGDNTTAITSSSGKFSKNHDSDIIVGTIGKILGLLGNHSLDLANIRFFVLDEADKLVNQENLSSIKQIYNKCPGGGVGINRLQVCFFSATLHSPQISELAELICINPTWIDLKGHDIMPETIHHVFVRVPTLTGQEYTKLLQESSINGARPITDEVHSSQDLQSNNSESFKHIQSQKIKDIKPLLLLKLIDKFEMTQCMIFCRTNVDCQNLSKFLQLQTAKSSSLAGGGNVMVSKYSHRILGGALNMEERRKNLQLFKEGEIRLLICTDVASRGIDVDSLPYVINMTLPEEADDYIHRIGRVGRSEKMGLAISIVSTDHEEKVWYHTCKNRGINCTNRRLVSDNGCTIWYNEALILSKISKKLNNQNLLFMSNELELPEEIKNQNIVYGISLINQNDVLNQKIYMTENMKENVKQLMTLEYQTQNLFLLSMMHHSSTSTSTSDGKQK